MSTMNSLSTEQKLFWDLITERYGPDDLIERMDLKLEDHFHPHAKITRKEALDVYANAYFFRILDVGRELYPALTRYLGRERTIDLWMGLLEKFPSENRILSQVGEKIPQYALEHLKDPILSELAFLEFELIQLHTERDEEPLDPTRLSKHQPEVWGHLRFFPKSDWSMTRFEYDVLGYWRSEESNEIKKHKSPQSILIWRQDNSCDACELDRGTTEFLKGITEGLTFGQTCERLVDHFPIEQVPAEAQKALQSAIEMQLLVNKIELIR